MLVLNSAFVDRQGSTWMCVTKGYLFSFLSLFSLFRKRRGAPSALSGSERIDALRYQRIKKAKKMMLNNNNSKTRRKSGKTHKLVLLSGVFTFIFLNAFADTTVGRTANRERNGE